MNKMINFVMTNDGSAGLYNHEVDDIYHSSYGAKNEAVEKFITPLNITDNFLHKNKLRVLDICFGIGYNTKAFLNEIINKNYLSNDKNKIEIDALEYDSSLALISPFIKDGFKNINSSYILLQKMKKQILDNKALIIPIIESEKNYSYFSPHIISCTQKYDYFRGNYDPLGKFNSFLHNIYYHYISKRYKKALKASVLNKITFTPYFDDARNTIQSLNNAYDIVFLDAFTPAKLPTLWSLEFFQQLYRLTHNNSMIVTYSNSAAVRHAFLEAGFYVGKTFDKNNRASGTVAAKNKLMINHPLDDFDLGLIKTSAGVYFCDATLSMSPSQILKERETRKEKLNPESSSHYMKRIKQRCK